MNKLLRKEGRRLQVQLLPLLQNFKKAKRGDRLPQIFNFTYTKTFFMTVEEEISKMILRYSNLNGYTHSCVVADIKNFILDKLRAEAELTWDAATNRCRAVELNDIEASYPPSKETYLSKYKP